MGTNATTFRFERVASSRGKDIVQLCRTDHLLGAVQIVRKGGETNLHSHPNLDGFWYVLRGRARFYGEADHVIGEVGPNEGVLIPRGVPYWFEAVGDEELHVLQVEASAKPMKQRQGRSDFAADRIDHEPRRNPPVPR